ncbi:MAG: hypothetical protein JWL64_2268 [Frankiales bacterium]|nr:hypothetical protein [Frankiales bacterium]
MSKHFTARHDVAAPVERVYALLASAGWPATTAAALNDGGRTDSCTATPEGGVVLVHSHQLPEGGPGFVQGFLPKDRMVTQTDRWEPAEPDGTRRGTWEVGFPGSPGKIGGTAVLSGGASTLWTVEGSASIRVPLVGGKIEGFLIGHLVKLLERQAGVLQDALRA